MCQAVTWQLPVSSRSHQIFAASDKGEPSGYSSNSTDEPEETRETRVKEVSIGCPEMPRSINTGQKMSHYL